MPARRDRIVGLVRSLGKRVYREVSRVRIPSSPPYNGPAQTMLLASLFVFFCEHDLKKVNINIVKIGIAVFGVLVDETGMSVVELQFVRDGRVAQW